MHFHCNVCLTNVAAGVKDFLLLRRKRSLHLCARAQRLQRFRTRPAHPSGWSRGRAVALLTPRLVMWPSPELLAGMEPEEGTPLWRLQKLPTEQGLQLLHKIIDGTCGRTYPLYQDYHRIWDSAEWMHVLEDITTFFKAVVGRNLSDEEVTLLQILIPL